APAVRSAPPPPPAPAPDRAFPAAPLGQTVGGLPTRRRRHASPEQAAAVRPAADARLGSEADWDDAWGRSAEDTARRMGAFARGTRAGRAETTDPEGTPQA
ncbi:ATP-binding protein, partial [Kitasatospora indigofera]